VLAKSSATDYATTWSTPSLVGGAARPLLTAGAYLDGTSYVGSTLSGNYASTPDAAALDITGDIEIVRRIALDDWTPSARNVILSKRSGLSTAISYQFAVETDGKFSFTYSTDGTTAVAVSSSVAPSLSNGVAYWTKVTFDVDNGASGNTARFYWAADQATEPSVWTEIGSAVTSAGTVALHSGAAALVMSGYNLGATNPASGRDYRAIVRSGIGGTVAFDADFSTQTADALAFTESSTNAATVTINTTRYTYGVPNVPISAIGVVQLAANTINYSWFTVSKACTVDLAQFEVTTGPASNADVYVGVYAADDNFNPIGAPIFDTGAIAVNTSATGVFRRQFAPVTLQPGAYVTAILPSVVMSVRRANGGITYVAGGMGANPTPVWSLAGLTAGALPTTGPEATVFAGGGQIQSQLVFLRWKAA
jgi:hypothetical protein